MYLRSDMKCENCFRSVQLHVTHLLSNRIVFIDNNLQYLYPKCALLACNCVAMGTFSVATPTTTAQARQRIIAMTKTHKVGRRMRSRRNLLV